MRTSFEKTKQKCPNWRNGHKQKVASLCPEDPCYYDLALLVKQCSALTDTDNPCQPLLSLLLLQEVSITSL